MLKLKLNPKSELINIDKAPYIGLVRDLVVSVTYKRHLLVVSNSPYNWSGILGTAIQPLVTSIQGGVLICLVDQCGNRRRHGEYLQFSLLYERNIRAVLDGESGSVQILGSNE